MCNICGQIPCNVRCPNAAQERPAAICCECGEGIYPDDRYIESINGYLCYDCLQGLSALELLEIIGEKLITAN